MKESGYLLDPTVVNPALQCILIYTSGVYGGMWSDNDHHWESSPLKDPLSWVQNKVLHLANKPFQVLDARLSSQQKRRNVLYRLLDFLACRHRSWQTHSELTLLFLYLLWVWVSSSGMSSNIDRPLWWLLLVGFTIGVISHLFLDMLTTEGIRFGVGVFLEKVCGIHLFDTFRLVPKTSFFKTGSLWEMSIRKGLSLVQYLLVIIVLGYLFNVDVVEKIKYVLSYFTL